MSDSKFQMTVLLMFVVALCCIRCVSRQCPEIGPVSVRSAVDSVDDLCRRLNIVCYPEYTEHIKLARNNGFTVTYSAPLCSKNLPKCRFAIRHERGHLDGGSESSSDCYAATFSSSVETDAAICALPEKRRERIRRCRL